MHKYIYDGPVRIFDKPVNPHWYGETMAVSEEKARTNLAYQYKKGRGLAANSKVTLPGQIESIY